MPALNCLYMGTDLLASYDSSVKVCVPAQVSVSQSEDASGETSIFPGVDGSLYAYGHGDGGELSLQVRACLGVQAFESFVGCRCRASPSSACDSRIVQGRTSVQACVIVERSRNLCARGSSAAVAYVILARGEI